MRKARVLLCAILIASHLGVLLDYSTTFADEPLAPVVITEIQVAADDELIELYNPNNQPLELAGYFLWYHGSGTSPTLTQLVNLNSVVLAPKQLAVFGHATTPGVTLTAGFSNALNNSVGAVFVAKESALGSKLPVDIADKVAWGAAASGAGYHFFDESTALAPPAGKSLERCFIGGTIQYAVPRNTSKEFIAYDKPSFGVGVDCILPEPQVPVVECEGLGINEIGANVGQQFIELYNPTDSPIAIAGCQLQTNRSNYTYILAQSRLEPNQYLTVFIDDTELTLTKTTTGEVYILSSDGLVETDVRLYSNLDEDTSWSYFIDGWRQTYELTPGAQNIDAPYPPCEAGYFRNAVTGRCNIIPTIPSLTPCDEDQYRSQETGRCRSLATTITRKPCRDDQYRSEETGRCRNLTLASTRKPCKDNQYRSEETGRCRNLPVTAVPSAGFAVQPLKENGMAFVGWWALGGVALLVGAYGLWEWRREITNLLARLFRRV